MIARGTVELKDGSKYRVKVMGWVSSSEVKIANTTITTPTDMPFLIDHICEYYEPQLKAILRNKYYFNVTSGRALKSMVEGRVYLASEIDGDWPTILFLERKGYIECVNKGFNGHTTHEDNQLFRRV